MEGSTTRAVQRCGTHVPQSLCGNLKAPACALVVGPDGMHDGQHKAHIHASGGGRVTFRWPTGWSRRVKQPPVIELPSPSSPVLNVRKAFRQKPLQCTCPMPGVKEHQHLVGCPRRRLG